MSQARYLRIAGAVGAAGVALGAFGAHGLAGRVPERSLEIFEIGVKYHLIHAVALLALSLAPTVYWKSRCIVAAYWAWLGGVVIFSGSLYALALTEIRWLGAITPIGGVALIAGWTLIICAAPAVRSATTSHDH